jgi:hypothetical protein
MSIISEHALTVSDEHRALVARLAKSGEDIVQQMTGEEANLLHMVVGVSGEVAEVAEVIFRAVIHGANLDTEHLIEECGDVEFYVEGLRQGVNIVYDPADCMVFVQDQPVNVNDSNSELTFIAMSLTVGAGNLLDAIKKHCIYKQPLDVRKVKSALDQLDFFMLGLRQHIDISRDKVLQGNVDKLTERYGSTYSDAKANARADKAGDAT